MSFRVHELSKKWGIKSADLLDRLADLGIEAASHMTLISDEDVKTLAHDIITRSKRAVKKKAAAKAEPKKPARAKKGEEAAEAAASTAVAEAAAEVSVAPEAVAPGEAPPASPEAAPSVAAAAAVQTGTATAEAAPAPAAEVAAPERAAPEAPKAGAPAAPESGIIRTIELPKPSVKKAPHVKPPKEPEKIKAVDEELLQKQLAEAAELIEKETQEESRILRRIILPPRKKPRKKTKLGGAAIEAPQVRRIIAPAKPQKVELRSPVTLRDFSHATGVKTGEIMRKLVDLGTMANINQIVSDETVELLATEFGVEVSLRKGYDPEEDLRKFEAATEDATRLVLRPPVVTILGHVDHGKTTLLDAIRHSDVAAGEFGGITQHIGAYRVRTDSGHVVTFLDTPGHEAFTEMRARGANVTDIVILVVAADDGVMPQTVESINHAKAAKVPIVVAINKIDKPEAQVDRVKRQLTNYGLVPEEWGGDTICVPVSALTGKGIEGLLEMLALQAEVLELKADPNRPAMGTVLEARRTEGKGIVASVLVQQGTLRAGDVMLAGGAYGRIRMMTDEHGSLLGEALPSTPVEVSGLNEAPYAGDRFWVMDDLQKAREIAETRGAQRRTESRAVRPHVSLENLAATFEASGAKELRVILKADVQGSLEVLMRTLSDLSVPEVSVRVIHSGIAGVNESDVLLADASDAVIVGFNIVAEQAARIEAERLNVEIRLYNVIYQLVEEMKAALENRLEPEIREVVRGHADVRNTFRISRIGTIAGCMVVDGVIPRRAAVRLARQGVVIFDGQIESLKHFKDDVREVREGFECGIKIAGYDDIKVGDVLEAYETEKVPRKLS